MFKLPAEGSISRALLAAVQGGQRDHHPGQAHPRGSCNQAVCAVLLHELAKSAVPTGLPQDSFQSFSEMAAELASQKTPAAWLGEISLLGAGKREEDPHHSGPPPGALWLNRQARRHYHQASGELRG